MFEVLHSDLKSRGYASLSADALVCYREIQALRKNTPPGDSAPVRFNDFVPWIISRLFDQPQAALAEEA